MAEQQPDLSEMSFAGEISVPELPPPVLESGHGREARVSAELLARNASSETAFGRAAVQLAPPKPAAPAAVSDEQAIAYAWNELPVVLSHFDLGVLKRIEPFRRGSRQAPKAVIVSDTGAFLVKRREHSEETQQRMQIAHKVQKLLVQNRYPAPQLLGTRRSGSTMVVWKEYIYEIFHFVVGDPYDRSVEEAFVGGRALGLLHTLLAPVPAANVELPRGSFHASPVVQKALTRAGDTLSRMLSVDEAANAIELLHAIGRDLDLVSHMADDRGIGDGSVQISHGDWHPGNLIFNKQRQVIGIVDYDTLRIQHPLLDVANGALQFSAIGGSDPTKWPDHLDIQRYKAFMRGYAKETRLGTPDIQAVPWLMAEAMGVEVLIPLATRGAFAGIRGDVMLGIVKRKMDWLMQNAKALSQVLEPEFGE